MRVFISSTCYDLLDLRAELETFLRDAGMMPILSDSLTSDFKTVPDQNSIESCLANVRSCDAFIVILSKRYGPSLASAGFDDVSATHLEYREAKKAGKPVHMFLRDRLEADFHIWRKNKSQPDLKLNWCNRPEDMRVFELIEEHYKLEAQPENNWYWTFRNSVELKQRLQSDFKGAFAHAVLTQLIKQGQIPLLEVSCRIGEFGQKGEEVELKFTIRNLGKTVAVAPKLLLANSDLNLYAMASLLPAETTELRVTWHCPPYSMEIPSKLTYSVLTGHEIAEEGKVFIRVDHIKQPNLRTIYYKTDTRQFSALTDVIMIGVDSPKPPTK